VEKKKINLFKKISSADRKERRAGHGGTAGMGGL
jgi:hypothetical protein